MSISYTASTRFAEEESENFVLHPMRVMSLPRIHPAAPMRAYSVHLGTLDENFHGLIEIPDELAARIASGDVVLVNGWRLDDEFILADFFGEIRDVAPWHQVRIGSIPKGVNCEVGECAARQILQLIDEEIANPVVAQAVHAQLARSDFYAGFFAAPASSMAHHDFPGGLALHSLEVALIVARMPRSSFTNAIGRDIALAAALLHDIGKVEYVLSGYCCHGTGHETRTIALLGPILHWLRENEDSSVAELLLYLLSQDGKAAHASCPEAIAVRFADRMSATANASQQAFASAPRHFKYAKRKLGGPLADKTYYRALELHQHAAE
ncbi:HD domain-containing protein [Algiphilus aromaticivorans]|uniref:HD domain-containing protein n=1 Tax=Algiphilus aromaticivorans TaxID=382454 RepID=UPI0005C239AE|nr:HD domain-containing protein [Algiphilus aromaticivorans]